MNAETSTLINNVWVMTATVLVLLMQGGFAMLEAGFSRGKNVGAVVSKVLANMGISLIVLWAVGFAIAFGQGNPVIGTSGLFFAGAVAFGVRVARLFACADASAWSCCDWCGRWRGRGVLGGSA